MWTLQSVLWISDILVRIRIRTTDLQIRIQIMLFSSVAFKMPTKDIFFLSLFAYYQVHLHYSSQINFSVIKKSQNSRNQGFSYYFCLMMEGSRSGRFKNIRILRIQIHNTKSAIVSLQQPAAHWYRNLNNKEDLSYIPLGFPLFLISPGWFEVIKQNSRPWHDAVDVEATFSLFFTRIFWKQINKNVMCLLGICISIIASNTCSLKSPCMMPRSNSCSSGFTQAQKSSMIARASSRFFSHVTAPDQKSN